MSGAVVGSRVAAQRLPRASPPDREGQFPAPVWQGLPPARGSDRLHGAGLAAQDGEGVGMERGHAAEFAQRWLAVGLRTQGLEEDAGSTEQHQCNV